MFRLLVYSGIALAMVVFTITMTIVIVAPWVLYPVAIVVYAIDKSIRVYSGEHWLGR
jgi:hypothetical protein